MKISILFLGSLLILAGCAAETGPASVVDESAPAFEEITKIDVHSHIFRDSPEFVAMMERIDLRIINICVRGNDLDRLRQAQSLAEAIAAKYPARFAMASTYDVTQRDQPDYAEQVIRWLDQTYASGALMTKVWKEVGMEFKKPDGSFLMPDDPIFDPIYRHMAQRGKPLIAHLAEPIAAWRPLDPENVHYNYFANNPEWHFHGRDDVPSWEQIIEARDRILEKHPDLVFIGAHIGSLEHDVDEVADRLDRFPNFHVEVAARTRDLSRQPKEKVRDFFIRYQDRIMYGMDLTFWPASEENPGPADLDEFLRGVETRYRTEYQYYAGTGPVEIAGKVVEGLGLPRSVLEKFYHGNARRIIPGLGL